MLDRHDRYAQTSGLGPLMSIVPLKGTGGWDGLGSDGFGGIEGVRDGGTGGS